MLVRIQGIMIAIRLKPNVASGMTGGNVPYTLPADASRCIPMLQVSFPRTQAISPISKLTKIDIDTLSRE
jgi:hypothetical protein